MTKRAIDIGRKGRKRSLIRFFLLTLRLLLNPNRKVIFSKLNFTPLQEYPFLASPTNIFSHNHTIYPRKRASRQKAHRVASYFQDMRACRSGYTHNAHSSFGDMNRLHGPIFLFKTVPSTANTSTQTTPSPIITILRVKGL